MLDGTLNVTVPSAKAVEVLHADEYAFIPADSQHVLGSDNGAGLLLFERRCVVSGQKFRQLHRTFIYKEPCLYRSVKTSNAVLTFVLHGDRTVRSARLRTMSELRILIDCRRHAKIPEWFCGRQANFAC